MGVQKNGVLWRRPSIGRAVRLQECPLGELLLIVKRQNWVLTLWMVRRILVYIFCLIMTQAYHYLMKLVNWNFWILKEHNNFSFLRKFEQFRRNSLWKTPNLQRMYELINVFPPRNFAVFNCCYFLCYWLQRTEIKLAQTS